MSWDKIRDEKVVVTVVKLLRKLDADKISFALIARESGVSRTTLYNHYNNVGEIFRDVMGYYDGLLRETYPAGSYHIPHTERELYHETVSFVRLISEHRDLFMIINKIISYKEGGESVYAWFRKIVQENAIHGAVADNEYIISYYWGGFISLLKRWALNGFSETPEYITDVLIKCYRLQ